MGFVDDAKETLKAAGEKIEREFDNTKERVKDKTDELKAESDVKKAEAERDSVKKRNKVKEELRD